MRRRCGGGACPPHGPDNSAAHAGRRNIQHRCTQRRCVQRGCARRARGAGMRQCVPQGGLHGLLGEVPGRLLLCGRVGYIRGRGHGYTGGV